MPAPVTLVVLPAGQTRLLRALAAAAAVTTALGVALALGAEDRDDAVLLPAALCIVLGGTALVSILGVALRWTVAIALDEHRLRVDRALLPARTLERAAIHRAVLATVLRPTRLGLDPARRLLLVDAAGRTCVRATWTEPRGIPSHALGLLAAAGLRTEELPESVTARALEHRHPGATTATERDPRLVPLVLVGAAVLAGLAVVLS